MTANRSGAALELLRGLRDDLPEGNHEKAGVIRAIELLQADPTAPELLEGLRDQLPDRHRDKAGVIRSIELLRLSLPIDSAQATARRPYPQVMTWSQIHFDRLVPLVPRGEVGEGDTVQSSHGYRGVVVKAETRGTAPGTTTLTLALHHQRSGVLVPESYPADSTIPVLAFARQQYTVLVRNYLTGVVVGIYGPFGQPEDAESFITGLAGADWWDSHEMLVHPMTPPSGSAK